MKTGFDETEILTLILAETVRAGGQAAFARRVGVSRQTLNNVIKGHRTPSPKILAALGMERCILYVRTK